MFSKLIILFLTLLQFGMILIDKIAATVNDEVITISDIEKSLFFYPILRNKKESEHDLYLQQLENMVNYKIIYMENKGQFEITKEDFESIRLSEIKRYGSIENFMNILKNFDMDMNDFMDFVRDKVFFDKVVKEKFKLKIDVKFEEIEDFYKTEYLSLQKKLGMTPLSLIEIASEIEDHLRSKKINKQLSGWISDMRKSYKISILLDRE